MNSIEAYVGVHDCPMSALEAALGVKNPVIAYYKGGTYKVVSRDDIVDENEYPAGSDEESLAKTVAGNV